MENNKKSVVKIIVITVLSILVLGLILGVVGYMILNKFDDEYKEEKTLKFYSKEHDKYKYITDESSDSVYLGSYKCTYDCHYVEKENKYSTVDFNMLEGAYKYNTVLLYDGEYILYNYKTKKASKTGIVENYEDEIHLLDSYKNNKTYDKGLLGLIVNNNRYYSMNYKKLIKIDDATFINYIEELENYGNYGKYILVYTDENYSDGYILDILTNKKSSLYLTDEKYDESNFTDDKILAKYETDKLEPVNVPENYVYDGSMYIIIYKNNYMQMYFGGGGVLTEYTRGKYIISNNKFTYSRMYQLDSDEWNNLKVSNNFGLSENEIFDINPDNTLSSSFFSEGSDLIFKSTLKQTYSVSNFQLK